MFSSLWKERKRTGGSSCKRKTPVFVKLWKFTEKAETVDYIETTRTLVKKLKVAKCYHNIKHYLNAKRSIRLAVSSIKIKLKQEAGS